jgi:hypothetical protein
MGISDLWEVFPTKRADIVISILPPLTKRCPFHSTGLFTNTWDIWGISSPVREIGGTLFRDSRHKGLFFVNGGVALRYMR